MANKEILQSYNTRLNNLKTNLETIKSLAMSSSNSGSEDLSTELSAQTSLLSTQTSTVTQIETALENKIIQATKFKPHFISYYNCQLTSLDEDFENLDLSEITDARYLFSSSKITSVPNLSTLTNKLTNMTSMFYQCAVTEVPMLDTSNATTMSGTFRQMTLMTTFPSYNTAKVTNFNSCWQGCTSLTSLPIYDFSKAANINNMLQNCTALTTLGGFINLGANYSSKTTNYTYYKLDLSYCTLLTHDSLMNVINNLYDLNVKYNVSGGGTLYSQSLVLGDTNKAKLTAEEIAVATNKGWTVS